MVVQEFISSSDDNSLVDMEREVDNVYKEQL